MKGISFLKLELLCIVSILPQNIRADGLLPSFELLTPDFCGAGADICIKVTYFDGSDDLISANESPRSKFVLKGRLSSNGNKAVIVRSDEDNPEDTIVFKSGKTGKCTRFSVDLSSRGTVSCLNQAPHPDKDDMVRMPKELPQRDVRSLEEIRSAPRSIDTDGYKMTVAVIYDDMFQTEFGNRTDTRIEAIMAIVDEMYSEKDTLTTEFEVTTVGIEHASGSNWGIVSDWGDDLSPWSNPSDSSNDLSQIAKDSPHDANLYVFLTGSNSSDGLGLATLGRVCEQSRENRVSMNKYAAGSIKGGDAYTAETVAHEMGHNIGLQHDCINYNCAHWHPSYVGPRVIDGVECYGYMDYKDDTNYWSACSVSDLLTYINSLSNGFCLESLVPKGTWGKWSKWSKCKAKCPKTTGTQKRTRKCNGGNCIGSSTETRNCRKKCPKCKDKKGAKKCKKLKKKCKKNKRVQKQCKKTCKKC